MSRTLKAITICIVITLNLLPTFCVKASTYVKPMIAAGGSHSLSLTNDGKVYAWGDNYIGQLGDGTSAEKSTPVCISNITTSPLYGKTITAITAGFDHSLALGSDGKVYAWGYNYSGQLGDGTTENKFAPVCISDISTSPLYGKTITAISAGDIHSLALGSDGKVYAWGPNYNGQLGDGTTISKATPVCISNITTSPLYGKIVTAITAGSYYSLAIGSDGKVYAWGDNYYGQLGDGTTANKTTPVCISNITTSLLYGKTITAISAGYAHSLALGSDGKVYAWGDNKYGQFGDGTTANKTTPICISDITTSPLYAKTVTAITAGSYYSLAIGSDGKVYVWGVNGCGQLGDGTTADKSTPVCISDITTSPLYGKTVVAISAVSSHSLALGSDGNVYAWGINNGGQLGDGTTANQSTPVCISNITTSPLYGKMIATISAGGEHSLALGSDGKVYAWGDNYYGQLGDGTTTDKFVPVCISNITTSPLYGKMIIAITAGRYHSLALGSDGKVYAWGSNWDGQLGDGVHFTNSLVPADKMMAIAVIGNSCKIFSGSQELTEIPTSGGQYSVKTAYFNNSGSSRSTYYVIATKSTGRLTHVQIVNKTFPVNEPYTFDTLLNLPSSEDCPQLEIKCMLWEDLTSAKPITTPLLLER